MSKLLAEVPELEDTSGARFYEDGMCDLISKHHAIWICKWEWDSEGRVVVYGHAGGDPTFRSNPLGVRYDKALRDSIDAII